MLLHKCFKYLSFYVHVLAFLLIDLAVLTLKLYGTFVNAENIAMSSNPLSLYTVYT